MTEENRAYRTSDNRRVTTSAESASFAEGFLREWARHENATRTACPECHFELADCCDRHRNNHAPGCSQEVPDDE